MITPAEKPAEEQATKIGSVVVLDGKSKHANAKRGKGANVPDLHSARASLIRKLTSEITNLERAAATDITGFAAIVLEKKRQQREKLLKG